MKLWVDYTNHRGLRAWRQISGVREPYLGLYPPADVKIGLGVEREQTMVMDVFMVDRDRRRTLALKSIHGFHVGELLKDMRRDPPKVEPAAAKDGTAEALVRVSKIYGEAMIDTAVAFHNRDIGLILERVRQLDEQVKGAGDACREAGKMVTELHKDNVKLKGECNRLEVVIAGRDQIIKERDRTIADLRHAAKLRDEEIEEYRAKITELGSRNTELRGEREQQDIEVVELRSRLERQAATIEDMRKGEPTSAQSSEAVVSFASLRVANVERQRLWDNACQLTGPFGRLYRANELGGEVGEALNVVKKLVREEMGIGGSRTTMVSLSEELADVVICADLLAEDYGVDLGRAVRDKFNKTSNERGYAVSMRFGDSVFVGNRQVR